MRRLHGDGASRSVVDALKAQGWMLTFGGSGHVVARSPTGARVTCAATPSDRRARLNWIADLRRAGFIWPPPRRERRREATSSTVGADDGRVDTRTAG
jgi:predicted RNA binding protein YcfA (HicA-like mRNA interferase family)